LSENSEDGVENPPADHSAQDDPGETKPGLPKLSEVLEALSKVVRKPRPRP
jgi:hypothetical protein